MAAKALFFFALLFFSAVSFRPAFAEENEEDPGLVMNFYKDTCPQAEDVIKEQVRLLYKRHKNTAFSWLRNIFHDCAVELGGPYIPLKTGRRDGRKSRADVLEQYLPDHNESISVVLERFSAMGIDTPGVVALLGAHSVGRTHCVKLVHRLYPEVDPVLNPNHVEHMLYKCPDAIPDPKAVQYVRNDRGTPMILDNNYYRNILDNKGLLIVDHQLATDKRTKPYVKKMAKSQEYFFKEFSRAITILSENNPLTGTKGEIRKQCNVANKHH
ncbi:Peroxidase 63 precursor, putative [Ricinus communis]|uniref:peroxidase n=1 Tax=Ricinus communis TaxID=3988 RepID=B9RXL3_RICCO|nr:Peroxidase 63 precursor, putative [Ricinus communis]